MNIKLKILFLTIALAYGTGMYSQEFNPADPAEPTEPVAPPVSLVLQANPSEGGTVTGAGKYNVGSNATVKATANTGFVFTHWTDAQGDTLATTASYTLKKGPRVETLTAHFTFNPSAPTEPSEPTIKPKHYITVTAGEGGTATTSSSFVMEGYTAKLTATPNTGYSFAGWYQGDSLISTSTSYTYTMKTENVEFTALFELIPAEPEPPFDPSSPGEPSEPTIKPKHYITVTAREGGTATTSSSFVMEGYTAKLTATPNTGYSFAGWYQGDSLISTSTSYTYTMKTENVEFTALFELIPAEPEPPFDPSSPGEPSQPNVSKNSLYLMTVSAKPGDDAECAVYFNAIKEVTDMTFQLGFPSGTTPLPDSLAVSDRTDYSVDYTLVNDSTIVINVKGDTLGVGNIKLLTLDLRVPEEFPVGTGYVITVNQVSVTLPGGTTETTSTRNSSLDVYKFGDADNSGEIDLVDLVMARDYLYGILIDGFEPVAVDLNRNGIVDRRDIELLTQLILNREP